VTTRDIDEQERERAILDAAAKLFLRHGYNKTTISDIADAVGLHHGLVYLHFQSEEYPDASCPSHTVCPEKGS